MKRRHHAHRLSITVVILAFILMCGLGLPGHTSGRGADAAGAYVTAVQGAAAGAGNAAGQNAAGKNRTGDTPQNTASGTDKTSEHGFFRMTMLNVGQGEAVLIGSDGHYMLYDGGGRKSSSYVVSWLKRHDVKSLDFMISSHYDEDHLAGLVGVLHTIPVSLALTAGYTADTNIYRSFTTQLADADVAEIHPKQGDIFTLGDGTFQVVGPADYTDEKENNRSIAIRFVCGGCSVLLSGDAETAEESDMISSGLPLQSDIYVVGHHGSAGSSSAAFVAAVRPRYAMISVGAGNKYGHPAAQTLKTLTDSGAQIFRSDLQGEVSLTAQDGILTFSQQPTTNYTPGTAAADTDKSTKKSGGTSAGTSPNPQNTGNTKNGSEAPQNTTEYVLNTHTRKFHYPWCQSVTRMKDKNKAYSTKSRDQLIADGYSPCGNCNP